LPGNEPATRYYGQPWRLKNAYTYKSAVSVKEKKNMSQALTKLLTLLKLEKIEEGLFRGQSEDLGLRRVFGGQVVGQALSRGQRNGAGGPQWSTLFTATSFCVR
jgi:hypothetical protein